MSECYYDLRAREYEQIYQRPDSLWQKELREIGSALKQALMGKRVLEVACGTGYWTAVAAETAKNILAVDASEQMLTIAKSKNLANTKFLLADAYSLDSVPNDFDAGLADFWLSHVPKSRLREFLTAFHSKLKASSVVFMADNVYVPGLGGELIEKPNCEDTFKLRTLADGSTHEVLKNYYNEEQLRGIFEPFTPALEVNSSTYFWWLKYEPRKTGAA